MDLLKIEDGDNLNKLKDFVNSNGFIENLANLAIDNKLTTDELFCIMNSIKLDVDNSIINKTKNTDKTNFLYGNTTKEQEKVISGLSDNLKSKLKGHFYYENNNAIFILTDGKKLIFDLDAQFDKSCNINCAIEVASLLKKRFLTVDEFNKIVMLLDYTGGTSLDFKNLLLKDIDILTCWLNPIYKEDGFHEVVKGNFFYNDVTNSNEGVFIGDNSVVLINK